MEWDHTPMRTRYRLIGLAAAAIFFVSPGPQWIVDALFHPWAHADPPLLDRWSGRVVPGAGDSLDVVLALERHPQDGCETGRCQQFEGTVVTCDGHGTVRRYRVSGSPRDRHGRDLRIGTSPATTPPPDGLELSTMNGAWDGADTLTLQASFFWRRGPSAISSTDDPATQPVPLTMRRLAREAQVSAPEPCAP